MKTKLLFAFLFITLLGVVSANATVPVRNGWWKFDSPADMLKAEIGSPLTLTGTQTSVNGPAAGNLATELGIGSHLGMTHGISPNGGGTKVNEYTLQLDICMPVASLWHAIYQTSDNTDDAETFINTSNSIGAWRYGYSTNTVAENTWYRAIISVKNGEFFRIYMNGELWVDGSGQALDERDALNEVLLLFADEDGEDNTMLCSEAGIWGVALTAEQAAELGDATTVPGVTIPLRAGFWKFDDANDMLKAEIGQPLTLTGTQTSVTGPAAGNLATQIGAGSFLTINHGIAANGGGTLVNEYTLQVDFMMPDPSLWHAIQQTSTDNSDDAEMFINTENYIGAWRFGYSASTVAEDTWYRLVISVKNGEFYRIYMNGTIWVDGTGQELDSRDALNSTLLMFADNDGEDNTMICSELGIWNVALTNEQVSQLGDANNSTTGIGELLVSNHNKLMGQNYPNPASDFTVMPYKLENSSIVSFRVNDLQGNVLAVINEGKQASGEHQVNINTSQLKSGTYIVQMITATATDFRKIVVLK